MSKPVVESQRLCKTFSQGELTVNVLRGIDLEVNESERIAIIGASGSGKSTLLHCLGGLDTITQGQVSICGHDLAYLTEQKCGDIRNQYLGFIYQFHHLLPEFTAEENVALPLLMYGKTPEIASEKARQILSKVGLSDRVQHKPGELSGGERQRAAIARALVTMPKCILADEPTGNLDEQTSNQVFDLMMSLNREIGTSLIMVTHNTELASRMDKVYRLQDGQLSLI